MVEMNGVGACSVDLSFNDVSVSVKSHFSKEKQILFNVSGRFPGGNLIGILGPSGAGKSTLLNVLSGFDHKDFAGGVQVNGAQRNMEDFKKISSYITQENDLHDLLTVEENMKFAADLKLGPRLDHKQKQNLIDRILEEFGLTKTKSTRTKRISGGQKKRLSIALELLSDPGILFLDEPTTGLDSFSSFQCVRYLKRLALGGKTIVCTIHQPSATLFQIFDVVYVLARGRCLYHGHPKQIVQFFDDIQLPCSIFHNPADYAIELANGDHGQDAVDMMDSIAENGKSRKYFAEASQQKATKKAGRVLKSQTECASHDLYEFKTLVRREYLKLKRHMTFTHLRIIASIVNSLGIGLVFCNLGNDATNIWINYNLIITVVVNQVSCGLMLTILYFPMEMRIVRKEFFNSYYSLRNFYFSITLLDLPLSFICNLLASAIIYYLSGQPMEPERFAMFTAVGFLIATIAQSLGLLLGASLNLQNAVFVGSYIHLPLLVMSGYGLRFCDIPQYFNAISYASYLRYGLTALAGTLYSHDRPKFPCPDDKQCYYTRGDDFLRYMCIGGDTYWMDLAILCFFYLVMRVTAYLAMKWTLR